MAQIEVIERVESSIRVKIPDMYKVVLLNDDSTTFEFVIYVLINIFHNTTERAVAITGSIHTAGEGIAGSPYTREVAEEKARETMELARANGFPLAARIDEL